MEIKILDMEGVREIYYINMIREFPADEIKPLAAIEKFMQLGEYDCYGLFEEDELKAYAFFVRSEGGKHLLLDYYVVLEEFRNRGLGSQFMTMLMKKLSDSASVLVEVENPDYARSPEDAAAQKRRISFYERNGYQDTGIRVLLYETEYRILRRTLQGAPQDAFPALDTIYHEMLGSAYASRLTYHEDKKIS